MFGLGLTFYLVRRASFLEGVVVVGVVQVTPDADELRRHSKVMKFWQNLAVKMTQLKIKEFCYLIRSILKSFYSNTITHNYLQVKFFCWSVAYNLTNPHTKRIFLQIWFLYVSFNEKYNGTLLLSILVTQKGPKIFILFKIAKFKHQSSFN